MDMNAHLGTGPGPNCCPTSCQTKY